MKNKIFYGIVIALALASLWLVVSERIDNTSDGKSVDNKQLSKLTIGNKTILVAVAKTEATRAHGLSGRQNLPENSGMLFVFDQPDFYYFWMKEMNFPLDIIWLDKNKNIVDITANLATSTYPNTVTSRLPAQYILELNAGWAEQNRLKIGDLVK